MAYIVGTLIALTLKTLKKGLRAITIILTLKNLVKLY